MQGTSDPDRELLDAAALVGHLVPAGSVYGFLAEHRQRLFPDELFADLFPSGRGRPSVPADQVATVMVLQSLEGLSDRDAIQALRTDLRWKVAAGVALDDEGFHPTVLTLWRNKPLASDRPQRIFDAVRDVVAATGVLAGKTRRALDSTLLDDAVATQDTVSQLVSMIRRVRRAIAVAAAVTLGAHDYDQGGKPACAWDDPMARDDLITGLVGDARAILYAIADVELDDDQQALVGLLALVADQDVEEGDTPGSWRIAPKVAKDRVISTVDPETRHMHQSRSNYRDGYKVTSLSSRRQRTTMGRHCPQLPPGCASTPRRIRLDQRRWQRGQTHHLVRPTRNRQDHRPSLADPLMAAMVRHPLHHDPERFFAHPRYIVELLATSSSPARTMTANGHDDATGDRWQLVVAEDCDEYLRATARRDAGAALGRLLNLSDGILGQGHRTLILLTTNEELHRLHPALTRPGRCLAVIEFAKFEPGEARQWLDGTIATPAAPSTLAELYEHSGQITRLLNHHEPPPPGSGNYL